MTFSGRQLLVEDKLQWMTTIGGRQTFVVGLASENFVGLLGMDLIWFGNFGVVYFD